jgi:methyl-accepting chemotaxis protein
MPIPFTGRRRRIVVDKRYQYKSTVTGILYILALSASFALPVIYLMHSMDILLQGRSEEINSLYQAQQRHMIIAVVLYLIGITFAWSVFSLWRTHKVAGPIIKITRHIREVGAGNFSTRIKLRAKDELQGLAEAFNTMTESLQERDRTIRAQIMEQIRAAKEEVSNSPTPERSNEVIEKLLSGINQQFFGDVWLDDPASAPEGLPEDLAHR